MPENADSLSGKLRKIISELGPLGMLALIAAGFIFMNLIRDDFGSGSLSSSSASTTVTEVELKQKEKIIALFDPIEEVTVDNIIISYGTIPNSSSTIFTSNQTEQVMVQSVVILHQGPIVAQYDVTQAISLLLDVPFHQISLVNTLDIIGGN